MNLPKASAQAAAAQRNRALVAALRSPQIGSRLPPPSREADSAFQRLLARLLGWFK